MKTAVLTKKGVVLIQKVELAVDFKSRLIGLLGRSSLGKQCAIYLSPCNCIHTFFMKFSIDLIFVSHTMKVKKIIRNVVPGRIVLGGIGVCGVVEMESGWFPADVLQIGDAITITE